MAQFGWRSAILGLAVWLAASTGFAYDTGIDGTYDYQPKLGRLISRENNGVKFHTYLTPLAEGGGTSLVVESLNALIVVDTLRNGAHNKELVEFLTSLSKPVSRIYVSHGDDHHWLGLEMLPKAPVIASEETARLMKEQGEALLKKAKSDFGAEAIPYNRVVLPSQAVQAGEERVEGILIRIIEPDPKVFDKVLFLEFPEQNAILHQHLGYVGVHAPMFPLAPRRAMLGEMAGKRYAWMMAGHGEPAPGDAFIPAVLGYFDAVEKAVGGSPDPKSAREKLVQAYPGYGAAFMLDFMLPDFYRK